MGLYEPAVIECGTVPPLEVISSSTPEMVPFEATVNVPTTAVAWLLLSYPENRNAYVPLTRDVTNEALAIVQFWGLVEQPVGSSGVAAAEI
jgi:hypothetical protein